MRLIGYAGALPDGSREASFSDDDGRRWRIVLPSNADPAPVVRICRRAEPGDPRHKRDRIGDYCHELPAPGLGLTRRNRWFELVMKSLDVRDGLVLVTIEIL